MGLIVSQVSSKMGYMDLMSKVENIELIGGMVIHTIWKQNTRWSPLNDLPEGDYVKSHLKQTSTKLGIHRFGRNEGFGGIGIFKSLKLNPNTVMQAKLYELKAPEKTYRLAVFVSNLFNGSSTSQSSEKPDISKYTQLLDTTASTLKLR